MSVSVCLVKPGVTCIWQVSGRSDVDFDTWIDMDLEYIEDWSLRLDLKLLAKTVPAVITGRGAYCTSGERSSGSFPRNNSQRLRAIAADRRGRVRAFPAGLR